MANWRHGYWQHGYNAYTHGCTCEVCRAAKAAYMRAHRAEPASSRTARVERRRIRASVPRTERQGTCPECRCSVTVHAQSARLVKHTVNGRKWGRVCPGWRQAPVREAA